MMGSARRLILCEPAVQMSPLSLLRPQQTSQLCLHGEDRRLLPSAASEPCPARSTVGTTTHRRQQMNVRRRWGRALLLFRFGRCLSADDLCASADNVKVCPRCTRMMYEAGWSVVATPLDTCGTAVLQGQSFNDWVSNPTPLASVLAQSYVWWMANCNCWWYEAPSGCLVLVVGCVDLSAGPPLSGNQEMALTQMSGMMSWLFTSRLSQTISEVGSSLAHRTRGCTLQQRL